MTVEERVTKLEEQMILQGALVARLETTLQHFMERTEEWMNSAENRMAKLEIFSQAVLERIDRFIAGQEGDGQH